MGWGGAGVDVSVSFFEILFCLCVDGGIPKNREVGGIYDFFVILGCRGWGRFWDFFNFYDLSHYYLI